MSAKPAQQRQDPQPQDQQPSVTKVTVNIPTDLVNFLKGLADEKRITVTDALRRAIESEKFLTEKEREGAKLLIEGTDNRLREILRR